MSLIRAKTKSKDNSNSQPAWLKAARMDTAKYDLLFSKYIVRCGTDLTDRSECNLPNGHPRKL
jgi:hypothetical protein